VAVSVLVFMAHVTSLVLRSCRHPYRPSRRPKRIASAATFSKTFFTVLGGLLTALVAVLTAIGVSAGVFTALLRSQQWTIWVLLIVLGGVVLGVFAAVIRHRRKGVVVVGSVLLTFVGIGWLLLLASNSLGTTNRPIVTMSVTAPDRAGGPATLDLTMTASGLKPSDRYEIRVLLLDKESDPELIFTTFAGGSADGKIDYKLHLPFQPRTSRPWLAATALLESESTGDRSQPRSVQPSHS
jgi:hypothetical protein